MRKMRQYAKYAAIAYSQKNDMPDSVGRQRECYDRSYADYVRFVQIESNLLDNKGLKATYRLLRQ